MGTEHPDPPVFSLETATGGNGVTTVIATGELDIAAVPAFGDAVRAASAAGAVRIDLSGLTFMDSSGVRALNVALREADEHGHDLHVRPEMQPAVVQILEMTGMMSLLPVEDRR